MKTNIINQAVEYGASLMMSARSETLICFTEKQLENYIDFRVKNLKNPEKKLVLRKDLKLTIEAVRCCNILERRGFKDGKYDFRTEKQLVNTLIQFEPFKSMPGNRSAHVRETISQMVGNKRLIRKTENGWDGYAINLEGRQ